MTKPPGVVRVMGQRFTVSQRTELTVEDVHGNQIEGCIGVCDVNSNTIGIVSTLGPERERETLLHECLHAISSKMGYTLERSDDEDEALVKRMAPILLDFLRSNPRVIAYLVER